MQSEAENVLAASKNELLQAESFLEMTVVCATPVPVFRFRLRPLRESLAPELSTGKPV